MLNHLKYRGLQQMTWFSQQMHYLHKNHKCTPITRSSDRRRFYIGQTLLRRHEGLCCLGSPSYFVPWWRHPMETFSALLAICAGNSPASGEFPTQRPVTQSFDVFFNLCLNKRSRKQSWGWWFWRYRAHYGVIIMHFDTLYSASGC